MPILDIGDGSVSAPDIVMVNASATNTVTVKCLSASADTLNVFTNGIDQAATNVTQGNSSTLNSPAWLQSPPGNGVTTVQITDTAGFYGNV